MSEPAWTPGPWEFGRRSRFKQRISGQDWANFAGVYVRMAGDGQDYAKGLANARLIAAAPDLYAALKTLREAQEAFELSLCDAGVDPSGTDDYRAAQAHLVATMAAGDAALAKARGEQP